MKRLIGVLIAALLVLLPVLPVTFGWGNSARRVVTDKAVDTLPDEMLPFFLANRSLLIQHTNEIAEAETKILPAARNNFIELDHYGPFPFTALPRNYSDALAKYSKRSLASHGQLPWQIGVYSKQLTDAFRSRNWDEVKTDAATLAYYVAAAHDPFKTTKDNDGKLAGQTGVNERFGIALVDRYQRFFFMKPNEATFIHDPTDYAFEMVLSAHSWLENILLADRRAYQGLSDYNDDYYDRFYAQAGAVLIRQLTDAATDTGSYWMTAWINAGRPPLPPN